MCRSKEKIVLLGWYLIIMIWRYQLFLTIKWLTNEWNQSQEPTHEQEAFIRLKLAIYDKFVLCFVIQMGSLLLAKIHRKT